MSERRVWEPFGRLEFDAVTYSEGLYQGCLNKSDADAVLLYFCEAVKRGEPVRSEVIKSLADAFDRYLQGSVSSVDKALGVTRLRPGNPGGQRSKRRLKNDEERVDLALTIAELMDGGVSYEEAVEQIRAKFQVSKKTAETCYSDYAARVAEYAVEIIKSGEEEIDAIVRAARAFSVSQRFAARALRKRKRKAAD